ncbi:MAG: phosphatase PAP2 family protein [Chitinophagaceae bacterium]
MKQENPHSQFKIAVAVSIFLTCAMAVFILFYGKTGSFLLINGNYSEGLDFFFQYATVLGDGIIYIPLVVYGIIFNRKYLIAIISGIMICTFLTQFLKRAVFPDELRPLSLELQNILIHKVQGVPVHRMHSFPSGHTATAFTMALLLAAIIRSNSWACILPLIALLVGYSRVYLGEHFLTDVCAGMAIGILSAYSSLLIYLIMNAKRWN